jgi:predicted aldo/keto reductase-like oxidoreductase
MEEKTSMADTYLGESVGKLGYGFMRLPEKADGSFDLEPMKKMVDTFLDAGFTYFDTAYVYPGSEEALRETLVKRHPRDRFTITTKMPMFLVNTPEDMEAIFSTSMERLGIDCLDFYFLHGINLEMCEKAEHLGAWDFLKELKAKGRIRHYGFSFHSTPEELEEILTRHPDAELVQLQINYLDWENPEVRSRELYETVRRHSKPFTIMEPVKGGLLAGAGSQAERILKAKNPDVSEASWAVRFAASLPGLITMLSGMGNMAQLTDNIKTIKNLRPLSDEELESVREVVRTINSVPMLPCTGCKYCVPNCPQQLNIPGLMKVYNQYLQYRQKMSIGFPFDEATMGGRLPSTCIACRACEAHCPQHIAISEVMPQITAAFET